MAIFVGGLGLVFGSFVTALVGRLHDKQNFTTDRSRCMSCDHVLSPLELVPVFSWLIQLGKCRHCREAISWQYPTIELTMSFLFLASLFVFNPSSGLGWLLFSLWLGQIVVLMALVVADLRYYLLPNNLVYPLLGLGVGYYALQFFLETSDVDPLLRISGVIFYAGIFYLLHHFSKGEWLGGGDVRLAFYLGLIGMPLAIMSMFAASLLGSVVVLGLISLKITKRETPIPFGPFLIAAHIITVFYGQEILSWYLNFVGITK
jgi:prepilin signal peptidase PulO-like enzyme (type II secretory pathway)